MRVKSTKPQAAQVAPAHKAAATKAANEKRRLRHRPSNPTPRAPVQVADAPRNAPERLHVAHQSQAPPPVLRFITRDEVLAMVGVSYGTLFGWIREGNFPPARELSGSARASRIYWLQHEVLAWMANRPPRLPRGTRFIYGSRTKGSR